MNTDFDAIFLKYFDKKCAVNQFRSINSNILLFLLFPQFLAASVKMMLIFQFGVCIAFMGIVNAALSGNSNEYNKNETLKLTGVESSWIGGQCLMFLTQ